MYNTFNDIYHKNVWNNSSGPGSQGKFPDLFRHFFTREIILKLNPKTVTEVGCGYWEVSKLINWKNYDINYLGYEIVPDLVTFLKDTYSSDNVRFEVGDVTNMTLNYSDIYLAKDVLQHWDNRSIYKFIDNLIDKKVCKYLILINCADQTGDFDNVHIGEFRPLNNGKYPLKFYSPSYVCNIINKHMLIIDIEREYKKRYEWNLFHCSGMIKIANVSNPNINISENTTMIDENNNTSVINKPQDIMLNMELENINHIPPRVLIAILAKNKGKVLDFYLRCIENLDYPKDRLCIWIRSNDNNDDTEYILKKWCDKWRTSYSSIYENYKSINESIRDMDEHDWTDVRLEIMGKLREESMKATLEYDCDYYFVADCDNFVTSYSLRELIKTNLPIVAPLLRKNDLGTEMYANFHYLTDNGFYKSSEQYNWILFHQIKGLMEVECVHTTYLIDAKYIEKLSYIKHMSDLEGINNYEYAIFSYNARRNNIPQYIDNRMYYGCLIFCHYDIKETLDRITYEFETRDPKFK